MADVNSSKFGCAELSLKANENIFGTAPRVDVWFLLEYPGRWTNTAFKSSTIPEIVKQFLFENLKSIPNSRMQLIKRENSPGNTIKFYIAVSHETEPKIFDFSLSDYEEILQIDIKQTLSGNSRRGGHPIFLVCTNKEYDKCCGKLGEEVYLEASKNINEFQVWRTTHLGGHRFAANFVCLPQGLYYGRVRTNNVNQLMDAYKNRSISLENYRGRTCYDKTTQAGEYFLRKQTGIEDMFAFRLIETAKIGNGNHTFQFLSESD